MKISKIGFYGIRNVGPGLIQTIASKGLHAIVYEKNEDIYHNGIETIEQNVEFEIQHWGLTKKDKKILMSRIEHVDSFNDMLKHDIDILIESVEENIDIKLHVAHKISEKLNLNIPIIFTAQINKLKDIVDTLSFADRVVNIHPVPSVPPYKIIELIITENTSDITKEIINTFFDKLDLQTITISDSYGGIGPRILISTLIEACKVYKNYDIEFDTFNTIIKKGLRMYKGPLTIADELGIETIKIWIEEMNRCCNKDYRVPEFVYKLFERKRNL